MGSMLDRFALELGATRPRFGVESGSTRRGFEADLEPMGVSIRGPPAAQRQERQARAVQPRRQKPRRHPLRRRPHERREPARGRELRRCGPALHGHQRRCLRREGQGVDPADRRGGGEAQGRHSQCRCEFYDGVVVFAVPVFAFLRVRLLARVRLLCVGGINRQSYS